MSAVTAQVQTNGVASGLRYPFLVLFSGAAFSYTAGDLSGAPSAIGEISPAPTDPYLSSCAFCEGVNALAYFGVRGRGVWYVTVTVTGVSTSTATLDNLTASAGTAPTGCYIVAIYRDRLFVSDGNNFFASRSGDHLDWDYTAGDRASAFAGNALATARLGDAITSLMPQSNDNLIVGCSRSIYQIKGDPADGGSIEMLTQGAGVFGSEAWCQDDGGAIYFVGNSGLYRIGLGGGPIESLSQGKFSSFFDALDDTSYQVQLRYDRKRKLLYCFVTKKATAASVHFVYDLRQQAFFKWQFPTSHGPTSSIVYDGRENDDYYVLLGGRDGKVRKLDPAALNDDGTAISSYVFIGPVEPNGPAMESKVIALDVTLGESWSGITDSDWNMNVELQMASDPYNAYANPEESKAFTAYSAPGIQDRQACRVAAEWGFLKVYNSTQSKTWSMDRAVIHAIVGGTQDGRNV